MKLVNSSWALSLIAILAMGTMACSEGTDEADDDGNAGAGNQGGAGSGDAGGGGGGNEGPSVVKGYKFAGSPEGFVCDFGQVGDTKDQALIDGVQVEYDPDVSFEDDGTGSIKVTVPFYEDQTTWQAILVAINMSDDDPRVGVDMTGMLVGAQVRWDSGVSDDPSYPAGSKLSLKSTEDWVYGAGARINLVQAQWKPLTANPASPEGVPEGKTFDPALVQQIGIQLETNGSATKASPGVFHIDNVEYSTP